MDLRRREFLKLVPGAAAAAACPWSLSGCLPDTRPHPPPPGSPEAFAVSACGGCAGGCGIRARVVAGRLVGVAGSSLHPINRGGLCGRGLASPHLLYHPDRIRGPLKRTGPRGSGRFRAIGWDEAIAQVAGRLGELRERGLPHALAIADGTTGLSRQAAARFLAAFGSPNHIHARPYSDADPDEALRAMHGPVQPAVYDLENARFVLGFGPGWLEGACSPVAAARAYGHARRGRRDRRLHAVEVGPRLSVSAAHADEWVPIAPGSEGVLALGLLHMVLREGLEDRAFLELRTAGFDLLREVVLRDHGPDAVSSRTGAPVATIVGLARRFATTRPALAIGDAHGGPGAQAAETRMAIHALNAAVGAIHVPGGVLVPGPVPLGEPPPAPTDAIAQRGLEQPPVHAGRGGAAGCAALLEWLDGAGTYPVHALIAWRCDPVALLGEGEAAHAALSRIPFVVGISGFLDETARLADLVLPEHGYLERWEDAPGATSRGFPVLGIRQPVVPPRHDSRHGAEILGAIAAAIGGTVAQAVPRREFRETLRDAVRAIHVAGRGALFDLPEAEGWIQIMERGGWRASDFGDFETFWSRLVERGGWWDPVYDFGEWGHVFATASGRLDFGPLTRAAARPSQHPPAPPEGYPLALHLYPLAGAYGDGAGPLPWVQDVLGRDQSQRWSLWVEVAPADAAALGIADGARVRVESPAGSVPARARVYPGVRPGVAAMPLGPGGARAGRLARALAAPAGALVGAAHRRGEPGQPETWVRVRKA